MQDERDHATAAYRDAVLEHLEPGECPECRCALIDYECPRCGVTFSDPCLTCGHAGYHAEGCPEIEQAPIRCAGCGETFADEASYDSHECGGAA